MAKREFVKVTPDGLYLLTVMNYSSLSGIGGLYETEVYFTKGFEGNISYLFQALGNVGSFAQDRNVEKETSFVIIGNKIIENPEGVLFKEFVEEFESKLNQANSPHRRLHFITENHLIWYLEKRVMLSKNSREEKGRELVDEYSEEFEKIHVKDDLLDELIQKYKASKKEVRQQDLFD